MSGLKSTGLTPTLRRTVLSPINGARRKDTGLSSSVASPKRFKLVERTPFSSTPTLENKQGIQYPLFLVNFFLYLRFYLIFKKRKFLCPKFV